MLNLKNKMHESILADAKRGHREKTSFWASETELNQFDLYHRWKGTPITNPDTPESLVGLNTRTLVEQSFVEQLAKLDLLVPPPDGQDQHRIDMVRCGIKISGKPDAILRDDTTPAPFEFKTSFGHYQKYDLDNGRPKVSYLKQLAIYMDAINSNVGYLVQAHFKDTFIIENIYQFMLYRGSDGNFKSGSIQFNINETYERWAKVKAEYIDKNIEPPSEYIYKQPIEEVDWLGLPTYKVSNARNNRAVIGDWQVTYSDFKNLIIAREGTTLGYTDAEIARIKELSAGFTSKKKTVADKQLDKLIETGVKKVVKNS